MLAKSGRTRGVVGLVAASTFTLGLATVAGVVPRVGGGTTVSATDVRPFAIDETAIKPVETSPASTILVTVPPVTEPAQPTQTAPPPVVAPVPQPPVQPPPEVVADPVINVVVPPSAPVQVPRRQPSAAEVEQAIAGLRPYVRSLFPVSPTHAQVAELGNNICTAFDEGQSLDQVKATGAQLVKKVPFATLLPGGDDYIIRTGVALYCPGHAAKLG